MPINDPSQTPGSTPDPSVGGLTPSRIKEIALRRTDRRAEKSLDLDYELMDVIQDFCGEYYFWWRKLLAKITTTPGVAIYDLNDPNNAKALGCEKIINAFYVQTPQQPHQLAVVTDDKQIQLNIIAEQVSFGPPCGMQREPGTESVIRIIPTPDAAYPINVYFWAIPSMSDDGIGEEIPLIPARYHRILVKGLEANCLRYTLGEGSTKFTAAQAAYELGKAKASEDRFGFVGVSREYTSGEHGVRSTNLGQSAVSNLKGEFR